MSKPTTGDALRAAGSFLFELRNAVELPTFERIMEMRAELTALASKEDEHQTPFDWSPIRSDHCGRCDQAIELCLCSPDKYELLDEGKI